jgi:hypothetical protein
MKVGNGNGLKLNHEAACRLLRLASSLKCCYWHYTACKTIVLLPFRLLYSRRSGVLIRLNFHTLNR